MIFFWKKCASIDDDFLGTFFIMINLIIINMISIIRMMLGHFHDHEVFSVIYGDKVEYKNADQLR